MKKLYQPARCATYLTHSISSCNVLHAIPFFKSKPIYLTQFYRYVFQYPYVSVSVTNSLNIQTEWRSNRNKCCFSIFLDKNKINCDNNQCCMRTIVITDSCFQLYIYKSGCKSGCFLGIVFKVEFISQQTTNLWYDMLENQGLVAQIK